MRSFFLLENTPFWIRRTQFIVQTFRGFGLTALFEKSEKAAGHFDVKKAKCSTQTWGSSFRSESKRAWRSPDGTKLQGSRRVSHEPST